MKRRSFLKNTSLLAPSLGFHPTASWLFQKREANRFVSQRPPLEERTFTSPVVEETIDRVGARIADEELAWMFRNCYPNTLDTTVDFEIIDGKPDTFIITGDIDAMWLRDSTAQVWPYMSLISKEEKLKKLVAGLVNRQVKCVLLDPYANAFYKDFSRESHWKEDIPKPAPGIHERKWEIDSLCYVIRLAWHYFQRTGDTSIFDEDWDKAMRLIFNTLRTEQRKNGSTPYKFIRHTGNMIDGPVFSGKGRPIKPVGLICSAFRPSDDATLFPFLIPSNIFAVLSLRQLADLYETVLRNPEFAGECRSFATEVEQALKEYAIGPHLDFGEIYAYEVDGFGNRLFMDDANVPSLMSLAYLNEDMGNDPIYRNTRKFLLSDANPYFLKGKAAQGQASPHTGKERIWPMGIILRAMTSRDEDEITQCLKWLKTTHAGTGFMHESFHKDDPENFTRSWFAWANTLFGELVIRIAEQFPAILEQRLD
jgi:meiotically up-regulated gene 157 (Mug157) protein